MEGFKKKKKNFGGKKNPTFFLANILNSNGNQPARAFAQTYKQTHRYNMNARADFQNLNDKPTVVRACIWSACLIPNPASAAWHSDTLHTAKSYQYHKQDPSSRETPLKKLDFFLKRIKPRIERNQSDALWRMRETCGALTYLKTRMRLFLAGRRGQ